MQTDIARARHRSPQTVMLKNENHVVEQIPGLEAHQPWLVTVLLKNDGSDECGFHTMCLTAFHNLTKGSLRAAVTLPVVGHRTEESLDLSGSSKGLDQLPFFLCEIPRFRWLGH